MTSNFNDRGPDAALRRKAAEVREKAAQPGEAIDAALDATRGGEEPSRPEKTELQAVAHGGEGQPHAYGAGLSREPPDASQRGARRSEGDGASPAASAATSRNSPRARRQGF